MGQKWSKQNPDVAVEDVVYEPVPYTEEEKSKAENSPNKPLPGYAHLRDRRPKMYPEAEKTYENVKKNLETPPERGEELPVYELATLPGCFYHGEWKKGRPHGLGRLYGINGIFYQGGFEGGVAKCRMGLFIYPDGSYYQGMFKDNSFHGTGTFYYVPNGTVYGGSWRQDRPNGTGREEYKDGSKYEGNFLNGKKHGQGKYTFADGKIYKGDFENGHIHGTGRMMIKGKKSTFLGVFENGRKTSTKIERTDKDQKIGGALVSDKELQDTGKLTTQYGTYEGKFVNGLMHDRNATFTYFDGHVYVGPFEYGQMHGEGMISSGGGHTIRGKWERGRNVSIISIKNSNA